jgi:serine/threonine-protein kinase
MNRIQCYCRGCNEAFLVDDDQPYCPQCGELMTACTVDQTLALDETAFVDPDAPVPAADDLVTQLLGQEFDCYSVELFVGKGGMAHVFRARHKSLQRTCAIKILSPQLMGRDPNSLAMFLAEARAAASVVHPNIVTVHNIGQTERFHYIELGFATGESLQRMLRRAGRLPPGVAIES